MSSDVNQWPVIVWRKIVNHNATILSHSYILNPHNDSLCPTITHRNVTNIIRLNLHFHLSQLCSCSVSVIIYLFSLYDPLLAIGLLSYMLIVPVLYQLHPFLPSYVDNIVEPMGGWSASWSLRVSRP